MGRPSAEASGSILEAAGDVASTATSASEVVSGMPSGMNVVAGSPTFSSVGSPDLIDAASTAESAESCEPAGLEEGSSGDDVFILRTKSGTVHRATPVFRDSRSATLHASQTNMEDHRSRHGSS